MKIKIFAAIVGASLTLAGIGFAENVETAATKAGERYDGSAMTGAAGAKALAQLQALNGGASSEAQPVASGNASSSQRFRGPTDAPKGKSPSLLARVKAVEKMAKAQPQRGSVRLDSVFLTTGLASICAIALGALSANPLLLGLGAVGLLSSAALYIADRKAAENNFYQDKAAEQVLHDW